jgi:beta-glucosidase
MRQDAQVGITLNLSPIYPADDSPETARACERADAFVNRWFLDPLYRGCYPDGLFADLGVDAPPIEPDDFAVIQAPLYFLGVNYYSRKVVCPRQGGPGTASLRAGEGGEQGFEEVMVPGARYTAMGPGWEVYPAGLTNLLARLTREYAPRAIVITENGAAFEDEWDGGGHINDQERLAYVQGHIRALAAALAQGVPLRGYFAWSLLDNFEWGEGYSKRFGLVYVDYATQRRIVKASGRWYADFLAQQRQETGPGTVAGATSMLRP